MKEMSFEKMCKALGGEYSSEIGLLEPDVGYDTLTEKEALKQWCELGHLDALPKDLTIFKSLGTIIFQSNMFQPTANIKFEQGFFKLDFDKEDNRMCIKSTTPEFSKRLPGVTHVCITAYPTRKPKDGWIGFPDWGEMNEKI